MKKLNKNIFLSIIFLLLSLTFITECESQYNRARRDGLWWNDISPTIKKEIVTGYYTGTILGFDLVREKFKKNDPCMENLGKAAQKLQNNLLLINPEMIVLVVDSIYAADTLNLGLMSFHTIWIAANEISQKDKKRVKIMYEQYKREDCSKFKNRQQLREYKQPF